MLKGLIIDICRIDRQLRETFLREIIKVEDKTGYRITREELEVVSNGKTFHNINLWEKFYSLASEDLKVQKKKINELNRLLMTGKSIDLKTLVGFFGYMFGYHEYIVHGANYENIFNKGHSGNYFIRDIKLLSGVKENNKRGKWLAISAFNYFCISYYIMANTNRAIKNHYEINKDLKFYFNDKINFLLIKKHLKDIVKNISSGNIPLIMQNKIDYIFSKIKLVAENIDYNNPIMPTISEVRHSDKRIKRLQSRIAQGPLTPPMPNDGLYNDKETIQYHEGTEKARKYFI